MSDIQPTIFLGDVEIDVNHFMFDGLPDDEKPFFTKGQVCIVFFAKNGNWLNNLEANGKLMLDGQLIVPRRRVASNVRVYTLSDVEKIAHGLAQSGYLPGERLRATLQVIRAMARLYQYI
jgi:hypothetical protein